MTEPRIAYQKNVNYIDPDIPQDIAWPMFLVQLPRHYTTAFNPHEGGVGGNRIQRIVRILGANPQRLDSLSEFYEEKYPGTRVEIIRPDGYTLRIKQTRPDETPHDYSAKVAHRSKRVFWLLNEAVVGEPLRALFVGARDKGYTLGFNPDDAGIGAWKTNQVVLYGWSDAAVTHLKGWFKVFYPKAKITVGDISPILEALEAVERSPLEIPDTPSPNPGDRVVSVNDAGNGSDTVQG